MSLKELKRVGIVQRVLEGQLSQRAASKILGVVDRQVRRIVKRYRLEGEKGLVHRLRGRRSNRRHPEELKQKALQIYAKHYGGFGPTLAHEKIEGKHGLQIGCQTLRRWLIEANAWKVRSLGKAKNHEWRARKDCFGEMIQLDGSHHDWLEGRGPRLVLMGYIDDATNHVFARFYDYEGTIPVLDSFYRYATRYGLPRSVYLDRHVAYWGSGLTTIEEQLIGRRRAESQFERALRQLGVEVIHAYSPQAKGRIERLFGTFQDRLVKEMRLLEIKSKETANKFLEKYLVEYNRRFNVFPKTNTNVHRWESQKRLKRILSVQTVCALRNDNTVRHDNCFYQVLRPWKHRRPKHIFFEERLDGKHYLTHEGQELPWRLLPQPVMRARVPHQCKIKRIFEPWVPPADHPYKRQSFQQHLRLKELREKQSTRTFLMAPN